MQTLTSKRNGQNRVSQNLVLSKVNIDGKN